jgi:hypothetical protein
MATQDFMVAEWKNGKFRLCAVVDPAGQHVGYTTSRERAEAEAAKLNRAVSA